MTVETKKIKKEKKEVMFPLGARVNKAHRKMIREIRRKKRFNDGTKIKGEGHVVRVAIERIYESERTI